MNTSKPDDWMGFFTELSKETQRGAAVLGAAWLDMFLARLIANYLVDDREVWNLLLNSDNPQALISAFGSRITFAYALGLIGPEERHDLGKIKNIRNKFAHELHGLSFETPEISQLCSKLKIPTKIEQLIEGKQVHYSAGERFIITVAFMAQRLAQKSQDIKTTRLKPVGDFLITLGEDVTKDELARASGILINPDR